MQVLVVKQILWNDSSSHNLSLVTIWRVHECLEVYMVSHTKKEGNHKDYRDYGILERVVTAER